MTDIDHTRPYHPRKTGCRRPECLEALRRAAREQKRSERRTRAYLAARRAS